MKKVTKGVKELLCATITRFISELNFPDSRVDEIRPIGCCTDREGTAESALVAELFVSSDTALVETTFGCAVLGKLTFFQFLPKF